MANATFVIVKTVPLLGAYNASRGIISIERNHAHFYEVENGQGETHSVENVSTFFI